MLKSLTAVAALAVASTLLVPTFSQAASADRVAVSYADLNLRAAPGRAALVKRIHFAAGRVCGLGQAQDLAQAGAVADCRSDAIARVQPALDAAIRAAVNPNVTVLDAAALIVSAQ